MSSYKITAAAIALCALAAPAMAGGYAEPLPPPYIAPPTPVAVPAPGQDWTGPSVGLRLGYAGSRVSTPNGDFDDNGVLYGLGAAYDFDFGSVVAGVGMSADVLNVAPAGIDVDGVARVGGRLGADLGDSLIYVTGGYAKLFTDGAGDDDGYYAGIGSETRLGGNLTLGAEILYHEFEDFNGTGADVDAVTSNLSLNLRF